MSLQDMLMQQVSNMIQNHAEQQQNTGFDPSALLNDVQQLRGQRGFNLEQVQNLIQNHAEQQQHTGFDASGLLNQVQGLFGQHQGGGQFDNVKSSDQDPYGDPANETEGRFNNLKSSDDDQYGDPGAQS